MRAYMPVLTAAGGVILVAACSANPPASGPARTAAADSGQCFYVPNVRGFREGAGDTVIVNTSSRDYYLLQTFGHCDIDYELQIGFDASGGNFVCSGDSATIFYREPPGLQRCQVRAIRKLAPAEVTALRGRR